MSVGATRHSAAMVRSNTAAHGSSWYSRVSRYAHTKTVGEVIAYVHASSGRQARWVYNAWMHSPDAPRRDHVGALRPRRHRPRWGHGTTFFTLDTAR